MVKSPWGEAVSADASTGPCPPGQPVAGAHCRAAGFASPARSGCSCLPGSGRSSPMPGCSEAPFTLDGPPLTGPVERVTDGDTIEIAGQRIRLTGLDAPEHGTRPAGRRWRALDLRPRRCRSHAPTGAWERTLSCAPHGHDRYGRLLAVCRAGKADIAEALVRDGLAPSPPTATAPPSVRRGGPRRGLWAGPVRHTGGLARARRPRVGPERPGIQPLRALYRLADGSVLQLTAARYFRFMPALSDHLCADARNFS